MASPFYAEEAEEEENGAEVVPPPLEFSDRSYSRSDTCSSADSQRHLRPAPAIPEVITTEYSDQTSSAEDLLSADDALDTRKSNLLRRQAQSDSQLLDGDRDKGDVSPPSSQPTPGSKESRSMSPSLELLEKEQRLVASLDERKKESKGQSSDANLLETETAGMSSSAPDLSSMTDEELQWLQSEGRLNQQSNSTDALEMESIVEHRMLCQQVGSTSPTSDDRTEANLDTSNTSVDEDFVVVRRTRQNDDDDDSNLAETEDQDDQKTVKENSASPSPDGSPSSRKTTSTSSAGGSSTGDRSAKTPTPSGSSQRLKSHRRSLSTSEVDVLKEMRKMSEEAHESAKGVFPGDSSGLWKPMADISEAKSSQSLNNGVSGGLMKGGELGRDLDERSRASSLHTNETFSPHETEESSDDDVDDEFHSAQENLSKTSLDAEETRPPAPPPPAPPGTSDLQDGEKKVKSGRDKLSKVKPIKLEGVVLRNKKGAKPVSSLPSNRYSADHIITSIDDYLEETDDDVITPTSLAALSHRRIKSSTASMLPKTSKSDYNLRQHLNSTGEQNESSASSMVGTSSNTSQDLQHLTVTSPQQKDSLWSNDSVFDQESDVLNASDIDVKVASDDSFAQSLESSLDHSLSLSAKFERTGSSDSLKKRVKKSPLLGRKGTVERESPSSRRKGGLSKEDVEPTIKTLRGLLNQDNLEDNLSDDDNVSRGSDKVASDLQRTPSSASDSSTLNKDDKKRGSIPRVPLSPSVNVTSEVECSSLDFQPGSPLARKRQAQLAEQAPPHPPSPLSFYQAKSPPGSSQSISSERKLASNSPNSIPSSPAASHKTESESKLSKGVSREEDDELTSLKSISEVAITKHSTRRSQKMRQAMSFDEGAGGSQPYSELLSEMGGADATPKEQSEDELSDPKVVCDITPPTVKDSDWNIKRVFKGDLFRRTKSSKKSSKTKKSGEAEQVLDPAVTLVQKQSLVRPKSAARVQSTKVSLEDEMTFMTPDMYSSYKEKLHMQETAAASQLANSTGLSSSVGGGGGIADVRRSVSMQVKTNHAASSHSRSSSLQVNTNQPLVTLLRRISDDTLAAPKRSQSEGHMLSPLEEELSGSAPGGFPTQPSGESDNEEGLHETEQLVSSIVRNPVLAIPDEISWDKTVNRKLYKKMNKTERDRQSILHELLQTEKRYFRVLHVLKLIFRQTLSKHVSEEALNIMFPELNNLIEISNNFSRKLEAKNDGMIFEDCSEVLLKQFSGEMYDRTLDSFGNFCSGHLTAVEVYKEHMKKKHFVRIMKDLHSLKECQRLTLPDYYTHVTQHLSKILTLLKRLTSKSESLKLDHAPRLREALHQLETLMSGVNKMVEYRKNRKELMYIQERLEVGSIPKSDKITNRKDLKNLSLVAYDRMLRKSGEATWIGHGKTLGKGGA